MVRDIAEALARLNIQNAEIIGNQRMPGPSERRGGGFSPLHLKLLQESDFAGVFGSDSGDQPEYLCRQDRRDGGIGCLEKGAKGIESFPERICCERGAPSSGNFFRRACQRNCSECFWKSRREDPVPGSVCLRNRPCRMRDAGIACSPASVFVRKTEILKGIDVMRLLSDIYYSSFYLDICSGEYQVIRPLPWLISSIPERGNFDAVFAGVARHLILPQYREEFQRKFCIEYIRENLNQESPTLSSIIR